jgi:hypothetical protein
VNLPEKSDGPSTNPRGIWHGATIQTAPRSSQRILYSLRRRHLRSNIQHTCTSQEHPVSSLSATSHKMDWTLPDRPRRLVPYGKANNRTVRSQTLQSPKEPNGNARRSRITTPPRNLRDTAKDNAPEPKSPSQDSRPSLRSPKRRKLTPTDDEKEVTRVPAVKTTYGRRKWYKYGQRY